MDMVRECESKTQYLIYTVILHVAFFLQVSWKEHKQRTPLEQLSSENIPGIRVHVQPKFLYAYSVFRLTSGTTVKSIVWTVLSSRGHVET